jgi:hypothetical protein
VFVCVDAHLIEYGDVAGAIDAALDFAAMHRRVGVDVDADGARRIASRALPGMVVCPRNNATFADVQCCPLTTTTALVTAHR